MLQRLYAPRLFSLGLFALGRSTLVAWILAWASAPALASEGVSYARNLAKDAEAARAVQGAVLVAFVGDHCPYCETVLNEFLIPMSRNPDYQGKVVMRRVETGSFRDLRDFSGRKVSHREFAGRHGTHMVPTVMLFSPDGVVLSQPLIGLTTVDYYGYYLDETIDQAVDKTRRAGRISAAP